MGTLAAEAEAGAAFDATTAKDEVVRAMITEGNTEVLTIEPSPEWGGTLIEEEKYNEGEGIPSTLAPNLETPQKKRRRSKEEMQASWTLRRRRTRFAIAAKATRARWENLEAHIEFPTLKPKENTASQEPVAEEPQIEGLLYENGLLKEEVQAL